MEKNKKSKMDPVVHFELAGENSQRMRQFYENVFGWKTNQLGKEYGDYVTVMTSEQEKVPGCIHGGFYQKTQNPDMNYPSVVIAVENLEESMEKVRQAGGKLLGEPMDIPKVGRFVSFTDTEGNRLSMLQPAEGM